MRIKKRNVEILYYKKKKKGLIFQEKKKHCCIKHSNNVQVSQPHMTSVFSLRK
jgi:hypothetical protein